MKKRILLLIGVVLAACTVWAGFHLPELAGHYLAWRVKWSTNGKVRLVNPKIYSGPGLSVQEVVWTDWNKPPYSVSLKDITLQNITPAGQGRRPFLIAVAGTGSIGAARPAGLRISGRVTGDFASGSYQITGVRVKIDRIGELNLSGRIETKGQTGKLSLNLDNISLSELRKSLDLKTLPVEGQLVQGRFDLALLQNKSQWQAQRVDFRVLFKDLAFPEQKIPALSGGIDGYYDLAAETGEVKKARVVTRTGGEINLSGPIGKKGFDFVFDSKGLYLEDVLDVLPDPVKEKMGLKVEKLAGRLNYDAARNALAGEAAFRFYSADGQGDFSGALGQADTTSTGHLNLKGLDLLALSRVYGEGAEMSGIANLDLGFELAGNRLASGQGLVETVPARGVSQYLNFKALKFLLALSSAPTHYLTDARYGYRKLAASVVFRDGNLTIDGLARKEKDRDYLLLGALFGRRINVAINPSANTISLEDLKNQLQNAFQN